MQHGCLEKSLDLSGKSKHHDLEASQMIQRPLQRNTFLNIEFLLFFLLRQFLG